MSARLTGRVVVPGDPEYAKARLNYNLNLARYPDAIVFCRNEADVINSLCWARANHVPFRVRSGRHSYENFSLLNCGFIIDISEMDQVHVNRQERTASVMAGAGLGHVYTTLWEAGATIPAGTEFSVGLSGLALGGGIGMLSRRLGLTCDNLIRIRLAVPAGNCSARMIEASKDKHPDLFWACCGGGGGNFGIVTAFQLRIHPISSVSLFAVEWDWEHLESAYSAWQQWAPFTDERLPSEIELQASQNNSIVAQGQFVGPKHELERLLKPLVQSTHPRSIRITQVPFIEAVHHFNEPAGNIPSRIKRSGAFIYKPLPAKALRIMKDFLEHAPNGNASIWQQALGGAVSRVHPNETAFYHRHALIAQEYNSRWSRSADAAENTAWVEALRGALQPYTRGDYVNWPDRSIQDWGKAYYGDNFQRLREVKTKFDPCNVFCFPQSIPPYSK